MKYMSCLTTYGLKVLEKGAELIYQWNMFFVGCAHILFIKLLRHKVWVKNTIQIGPLFSAVLKVS